MDACNIWLLSKFIFRPLFFPSMQMKAPREANTVRYPGVSVCMRVRTSMRACVRVTRRVFLMREAFFGLFNKVPIILSA